MKDDSIIKIVKEDILRILGEKKEKVSLKSVKNEIKVSHSFVSEAIDDLKERNLICVEGNFIRLTESGLDEAKDIVEKHLILEDYFKRTKSEKDAHEASHIFEHYVSEEVIKNIKKLSTFKERGFSLLELELNKEVLIADITISCNDLFERIVSMGIFPGEKIRLTSKIPGTVIVRIDNKKFAMDKSIAKEIKVLEQY